MRLFFLLVICLSLSCGDGTDREGPPNILILMMDTTRGDRCSLNGYERETTPNLVRLAGESTVFLDAWSPSSWTGPAHASLFTGLRPENHGFLLGVRFYLDKSSETLAERLRDRGYRTACLTNNVMIGPRTGLVQGFDVFESVKNMTTRPRPLAKWTVDRALTLAKESREKKTPFFLFINSHEPHLPYEPTEQYGRRFVNQNAPRELVRKAREFNVGTPTLFSLDWRGTPTDQYSVMSDLYDAEIASLDAEFGRLVEGLRQSKQLDDTVVIVVSDHGENLGDHGLCDHVFSLHRTLLHIPLLIRFPERFEEGKQEKAVVRLEDLFPTVLALAGAEVPEGLDGVSLVGNREGRVARALLGSAMKPPLARKFPDFHATDLWHRRTSVYDGRHHLVRTERGAEELYDVTADPLEKLNLAPGDKKTLERLRPLLPEFR